MTLLFGCQRPDEDHLYREEMLEMVQKGVLHEVHTAYSRLPGQPKVNAAIACAVGRALKAQTMVGALAAHMPPHLSEAVIQLSEPCCEANTSLFQEKRQALSRSGLSQGHMVG